MRGPNLRKTTILSFTLHLTACLIILVAARQSNRINLPPPYTVSLVSHEVLKSFTGGERIGVSIARKESPPQKTILTKNAKEALVPQKDISSKQDIIDEKISLIKAKKQVEKTVRLRSVINLSANYSGEKGNPETNLNQPGTGSSNLFNDYYAQMENKIWQQWSWPETGRKDLLAVISIKILRDGTIKIQKMEKSSGNSFFDKEALKALTKANPLPPPPDELEVSLRFYP